MCREVEEPSFIFVKGYIQRVCFDPLLTCVGVMFESSSIHPA